MLWAPRPCADSGLGFVLCLVTHPSRLLPGPSSALMLRLFRWALLLCLALVTAPHYGHLPKRQLSVYYPRRALLESGAAGQQKENSLLNSLGWICLDDSWACNAAWTLSGQLGFLTGAGLCTSPVTSPVTSRQFSNLVDGPPTCLFSSPLALWLHVNLFHR